MNKRMLYIGTPKCASRSIKMALLERYKDGVFVQRNQFGPGYHQEGEDTKDGDLRCVTNTSGPVILDYWKPAIWHAHLIPDKLAYQDEVLFNDDFYKWTVVRNPWHRIASTYEYLNDRKYGCHGQGLDMSFSEYVKRITITPFADICQHENPWRYAGEKNSYSLLKALAGIHSFNLEKINESEPYSGMAGIGCLWIIFSLKQIMKGCSRQVSCHTQRWENSSLFQGTTTVDWPDQAAVKHILGDKVISSEADIELRYQVLTSPFAANVFPIREMKGNPHPLDRVIKFENLKDGIAQVCEDLEIETLDIPHMNDMNRVDKERHYEKMYGNDEELISAVRDWYTYEIETFGYEFGTNI